ncbi:MAG: hypothetical protein AAGL98_03340 [Planctomycetota bacterium]
MRFRSLMGSLVLAAAFCLPWGVTPSASAESGAHRQPPPPPVDTPIVFDDLD